MIQQAGKLPIPIVRSILYQVGSALTYAHRSGVVHRDIKPANILIDEDGNAVVTDFGIAKVADQPSETHPGALVGTPAYMSPEQCSGAEVSGSSDQYSLGAVAYELITGVSPFSGSTLTVMQAHLEQQPRPIRGRCGECPPELERAVLRMLEKDPAARWSSIAQAKSALGAAPLAEEDPLLAQLCRIASPDSATSLPGKFMPPSPRTEVASTRPGPAFGLVRTITILPPPAALETGDRFNLVALVKGERGVPVPGRAVHWATDTPEVLRVDGLRGVATAAAPGSAQLTATCDGIRARLQIQVAPPMGDEDDALEDVQVAAIQMSAPPKSVKAGDSFILTATPVDSRGGLLLGHVVQWSTSDVGVAVVTASGWVAALGQGWVVLKATCDGASASVEVTVGAGAPVPNRVAPPLSKPASPPQVEEHRVVRRRRVPRSRRRVLAASLGALLLTPVIWLSGALEHVVPRPALSKEPLPIAGGLPSAGGEIAGLTSAQQVPPVLRGAPASLIIIGSPRRSLLHGASIRMLAEVHDGSGRTLSGPSASWSSTNPAVARVDSASGWVHADRAGRAWVVATSEELRDSAQIVVRRPAAELPAVAAVSLSPHGPLWAGDTATLVAAVLDGNGRTLPGAPVMWASSQPQVVGIDSLTGQAQAYAPGIAIIVASSGLKTGSFQLRVLPTDTTVDTLTVQAYEPETPSEKPEAIAAEPSVTHHEDHPLESTRLDATMRMGVEQCYDALRSKDVARVAGLYRPMNKSDEGKLNKLTRIFQTEEWAAADKGAGRRSSRRGRWRSGG